MSTKLFVLPNVLVIFACCWSAASEDCRLTPDGTCVAVASSVLQISSRNGGALGQLQHNTSMTQASEESAPYQFDQTGIAGPTEIWNVGRARGRGVPACFKAVQADSRCAKDYFTYVTRGDRNCGCKGSKGPLNARGDHNGDIFRIDSGSTTTTTTAAGSTPVTYHFDQIGIAGSREIWNVGHARGRGVSACFQAVQADSRCAKDYFTYVTRGDRNCGCKGSNGPLNARGDHNGDIFKIGFATTAAPTTQAPTTLPPTTQAPTTILPTTQAPTIPPTTATTTSNGDVFIPIVVNASEIDNFHITVSVTK